MFGIHHLSPKHQVTASSGVYITTSRSGDASINYLKTLLQSTSKSLFISLETLPSLFKNIEQHLKIELKGVLQSHQSFFISKNKSHLNLDKLTKDLRRCQFNDQKNVILYLSDRTIFSSKNKDIVIFFKELNKISRVHNLSIQILCFSEEIHNLNHWLMDNPQFFFGISSLYKVDTTQYIYQVHYWLSQGEISTNYEYDVIQMENGEFSVDLNAIKTQSNETIALHDDHFIYISENAIDSNQNSEQTMFKYIDNQALFDGIDKINTGTIVLSLNQQSEVHNIALQTYRLRRQFGFEFKVVIREMQQCLRYSDETFLSRSGINLIIPSSVRYPRFLSMLETLQKQEVTCQIPNTIDDLLALDTTITYDQKGYVNNHRFVNRCHQLIQQYEKTSLKFALVKLSLIPGIDLTSCLSMCHIKRDGDLITACNDALYVLLSSVRENDVQIALNHIFHLPIVDMFQSNTIYTTIGRIKSQLPEIITTAVVIDESTKNQAGSLFTTQSEENENEIAYATHNPLEFSL